MDNDSGGSYGILHRVPLRAHVYNAINHRALQIAENFLISWATTSLLHTFNYVWTLE